ncbi:hypothetical protein CNMCM8980_005986 [Aspergillus fumigatiaffinis]|uniref:Uncharacterized protein n=1 Tax=Aspergillus fumigatiaffinis TaxID=340414 RepID=A0A8H4GT69_9EURO|nr:hypothetical protein CNMCM6805_002586 [Aspergillus fumigatiaffinis]KAF4248433.1 hypothetical protein CNMCM8980_005986 [Aspergillus fumigatiaffinis]
MGVVESKALADALLSACRNAEIQGKDRLDDELLRKDEQLLKAVKNIHAYIPRDMRKPVRQTGVKKAIQRSTTKLEVPKFVQNLQDKRESLFHEKQIVTGTHTNDLLSPLSAATVPSLRGDSIASQYKFVVYYEEQHDMNKVRLRLSYVLFYRLKEAVEPSSQYQNYDTATFIAKIILESPSITDSLELVRSRVRSWIGHGERYTLIANDLGGLGALYILPDLGGESIWTKELPKKATNTNRITLIESLKQQGIPEEARRRGLHACAEGEIANIYRPLRKKLNAILYQGLSQTHHSNSNGGTRRQFGVNEGEQSQPYRVPSPVSAPYNSQASSQNTSSKRILRESDAINRSLVYPFQPQAPWAKATTSSRLDEQDPHPDGIIDDSRSSVENVVCERNSFYELPVPLVAPGAFDRDNRFIQYDVDGAVFHHTENAPVAPASDNSFQRPSAHGVHSVDVARGFEDVMAQSATCSANHQNIVQGFEDGFVQSPASTLGCNGTVWGVENDLTQSAAGAFAYENIARGFEPGSIHQFASGSDYQNVARGFEDGFYQSAQWHTGMPEYSR